MNSLIITLKNIWYRRICTGLTVLGVEVSVAALISKPMIFFVPKDG